MSRSRMQPAVGSKNNNQSKQIGFLRHVYIVLSCNRLNEKVSKATGQAKTKSTVKKRGSNTTDAANLASAEEDDAENSDPSFIARLSKKKQQYMVQAIEDKSGTFDYANDPIAYKKARKRLQNRESAVRSR